MRTHPHRIHTLAILALCTAAWSADPDGAKILKALEANDLLSADIHSQVAITENRVGQGAKAMKCEYFRRDADKSFVIAITAPESDRGNGYLRQGDHFWMYRRNTRTFQHVNRDESIGGSDAKGQDFESRPLTQMYAPTKDAQGRELVRADTVGGVPCWRLEVRAIVSDVDYPKKTMWVRQSDLLLAKDQSYSSQGTLMRTGYYTKYQKVAQRQVPMRQVHVDEVEKGNRTLVDLSDIKVGKLDPAIFTKAWLESRSK
ncbi:MAG TPA: outer membrane lipoprotein-sorting protein [Fibrobacteria bacterium]|nr:outer membrane lipoprotein-sorting protein [Fibrobacteria bacterium]HOX51053.1 outer membrane lipoprotein-sorting protein [Fibrobacteria bacterium]